MSDPSYAISTESRFLRQGRSFTLLSVPLASSAITGAAVAPVERVVLIVLPPGPEQSRSYRLLRELAASLARAGIPTLRLELSGTGHSTQNAAITRISNWHEDIVDSAELLRTRWPNAKVLGVGARYSVRLLLDVFAPSAGLSPGSSRSGELAGLVCWSPLLRGSDWVEHLQRVQADMVSAGWELDDNDLAGEPWSTDLLNELKSQHSLPDLSTPSFESTLVLEVDSNIDINNVDIQLVTDLSLKDWVSDSLPMLVSGETSTALELALQGDRRWPPTTHKSTTHTPPQTPPHTPTTAHEQPFCLDALPLADASKTSRLDSGLFGIYRPGPAGCPAVVMLNSGLIGCSGPYGVYAEIACGLAQQGVASVRFDCSGKGESPRKSVSGDQALRDDYAQITDFLRASGHQETILLGICSGADDALTLAAATDNVAGLVLLDGYAPKTASYTRHFLQQRLTSPARIRHWVKRKSAALRSLLTLSAPSPIAVQPAEAAPLELRNWASAATMRARYLSALDRQCSTLAVFTGGVQDDYYNHQGQLAHAFGNPTGLSEHYLPHLDHLYPATSQRRELTQLIAGWVSSEFLGNVSVSVSVSVSDGVST